MRISLALIFLSSICLNNSAHAADLPPDITVATDGTGDFKSVEQAVQSIPKDNHQRIVILIKDGVYKEKVRLDASCVTLRGQSRQGTKIQFPILYDDFRKKPDDLGRAVLNINGDDAVLENLTVENTYGVAGHHEFTVYGLGTRTVIIDSDILSAGNDTLSLWWPTGGMYYHARCNFRGSVDFVCPRGWCYVTDSSFYEERPTASVWHDGHLNKDMKFVLNNCRFAGVDGFILARHHIDAQFFFLNCTFPKNMADRRPLRVVYPLSATQPSAADIFRNKQNDKLNLWGERSYFFNCHRDGGDDFAWYKDNLSTAPTSPAPKQITAAWTFAGKWDPENIAGPKILKIERKDKQTAVTFSEPVTVKGNPRAIFSDDSTAPYTTGSGTDTLLFSGFGTDIAYFDLNGGWVIASEADATIRNAQLMPPS